MTCPICVCWNYRIDLSDEVCEKHLDHLISVCVFCNRPFFQDPNYRAIICQTCASIPISSEGRTGSLGFNKDRRAILRSYGLE